MSAATGEVGKIREPVVVWLLSLVTLGIYGIVWQWKSFNEMKRYSGNGMGGAVAFLIGLLTFGLVPVFLFPAQVGNLYSAEGRAQPVSGVTGFWVFLPLLGSLIWLFKTQGALNDFWRAKAPR
jgi:hypothetical protein